LEAARRRRRGASFVVIACLAVVASLVPLAGEDGGVADAQRDARPSFVVVMTDDQDVTSMMVMRKVNRHLVRRGTTFENFYVTLPACCPSRVTFLTGQYAHNHGITSNEWQNRGGFRGFRRSESYSRTIARALRRAGYRTASVGKQLNGYPISASKARLKIPGFSRWFASDAGRLYGWSANDNGKLRRYTGSRAYQTDVLARKAARFIRGSVRRRTPFFVAVATVAPHAETRLTAAERRNMARNPRPARRHRGAFAREPLPRPPSFNASTAQKPSFVKRRRLNRKKIRALNRLNRSRRESLLAVDDLVGRLVRQLRRVGKLNSTYFIFTSDNGMLMGEHRLRGKRYIYEPSAKVPMVIRGPGVPAGKRRRQITGNIDLAPTILRVARARPLLRPDGISLLPLAADPRAARNRAILLTHSAGAIRPRPGASWRSHGVRAPGWIYLRHRSRRGAEHELYHLDDDPDQLENLAWKSAAANPKADPELVAKRRELAQRLRRLRGCSASSCR
jgi:N-acetylglucosamine-6-sulfatase